jgi:hypothetical protein
MSATSSSSPTTSPPTGATTDPEVVRSEIDDTRRALGDSIDALADKIGVKARVSAKITEGRNHVRLQRTRLSQRARQHQAPLIGAITAVAAAIATLLLRRRHRSR